MRNPTSWWRQAVVPLGAAFALRLFFVWRFPVEAGDTRIYEELARNWLEYGVYGLWMGSHLSPVDIRVPGYPAFLAVIYLFAGYSRVAVFLVQAALDTLTCLLVADLAACLGPEARRTHTRRAALWLAALCPFAANYAAAMLTETLAIFLTAAALLIFARALLAEQRNTTLRLWFGGGLMAGLGTLVRPETPLLLLSTGLLLAWWLRRPAHWPALMRVGSAMAAGLALALLPWGARNWVTLGRAQFLAPRYAELPGEAVPHGFNAWTKTWLVRFRDVYLTLWKVEDEPIPIEDLPASAFDSPEERQRVAALLERYNESLTIEPDWDAGFAQLARERTARHPLRTWLWVPVQRALTLWFTPRTELLNVSGNIWPLPEKWKEDPRDLSITLALGTMNILYCALALAGAASLFPAANDSSALRVAALLVAFIFLRTAFFTTVETPEPRYVLVCYPAVMALAARFIGRAQA